MYKGMYYGVIYMVTLLMLQQYGNSLAPESPPYLKSDHQLHWLVLIQKEYIYSAYNATPKVTKGEKSVLDTELEPTTDHITSLNSDALPIELQKMARSTDYTTQLLLLSSRAIPGTPATISATKKVSSVPGAGSNSDLVHK